MDHNLERSVRLLEEALSTPAKGLFKTPKKNAKADLAVNLSLSLAPHEIDRLLRTERESYLENYTISPLAEAEKTLAGSVINLGTPWKTTLENLYVEFADILQTTSGGSEILEVAADLARCCSDALSVIRSLKSKVNISELPEEKWLENERNSWRLIFALYQDRLQSSNIVAEEIPMYVGTSEKNCMKTLFKRENLLREVQLVIDWLERNSLEKDDPILHHSDWTFGWEHTLHQLLAPDSIAWASNVDIVGSIHPDAPQFENKSLHHLDAENEKKLCKRIFMEIRCGNLQNAQELAYSTGHPWKAALLEGWKLFHNPNVKDSYEENGDSESFLALSIRMGEGESECDWQDTEGNSTRDLWKLAAIEFCKSDNHDMYEKAAVACLSGNLNSMLAVCSTWEDYLWAYMRTMVDVRVESEIRDIIIKKYEPLPDEYWEQKMSLGEIFTALEASQNPSVQAESRDVYHIIQKHIILDDSVELLNLLDQWIQDASVSTHSLRFYAHLVLFLDNLGDISNRKAAERVIEAYIARLSEMTETQLVAFYASKLVKRKQVLIYAKHLEKILDNDERKTALKYAEDFSLDLFAITKRVVECITNQPSDLECSGNLQRKVTEADVVKISALDWLIFYEEQRAEALQQINALIFKFLTLGKLEAAQLAINKVPQDSVQKISNEEVSENVEQTVKDYLSYKAYLDAQEGFNDWFKQYRNKPAPPADLPESAHFTEKVAHEHKVSQYNAELERWKLTTSHSAKTAKTLLYNVLLFPQGWLMGAEDAEYLRSVCIPEIVLLLYSVLSESGQHEEAVRLADLIAAEKHALYKVYSKEKLGEILAKIAESSVALLHAKKDPWGNHSTA